MVPATIPICVLGGRRPALPALFWLEPGPTWCFSDSGGTTPSVDGGVVTLWKDRSGNGNHILTDGSATLRRAGGAWWVDSGSGGLPFQGGGNPFTGLTSGEILAVVRNTTDTPSSMEGWTFGTGFGPWYPFGGTEIDESFGTSTRRSVTIPGFDATLAHLFGIAASASEYTLRMDGVRKIAETSNTVAWASAANLSRTFISGVPARRLGVALGYSPVASETNRRKSSVYAQTGWSTPALPPSGLSLVLPQSTRTWQRVKVSRNRAVPVTGTNYSDSTRTIEAAATGTAWDGTVYDGTSWHTVQSGVTSGSTFSGTITLQEGQYTLAVRFAEDHTQTVTRVLVSVGPRIGVDGQSNSRGAYTSYQTVPGGLPAVPTLFDKSQRWRVLADPAFADVATYPVIDDQASSTNGSIWPLVAGLAITARNAPIEIVALALGGHGYTDPQPGASHTDTSTISGAINKQVQDSGDTIEVMFAWMGESDDGLSAGAMQTKVTTWADAIAADFGCKAVIVSPLQVCPAMSGEAAINAGLAAAVAADPTNIVGTVGFGDLTADDGGFHLNTNAHATLAAGRVWTALAAVLA
jgi:hypothetical protein